MSRSPPIDLPQPRGRSGINLSSYPINNTRMDEFDMVEVKHKSRYSGSDPLLAHQTQQVYYQSYPHPSFKNWWVVYMVRPEMHTCQYDEYVEGHKDDDIYQEEIEVDQNFTVSNRAGLVELGTGDIELLDEEAGPSNKHLQKSKHVLKRQERCERLHACVAKQIKMPMTFDM
jgi:hypothetical protein